MAYEAILLVLLGAAVSFIGTVWFESYRDKQKDAKALAVMKTSLVKELEMNQDELKQNFDSGGNLINEAILLYNSAFESAVSSGSFSLLSIDAQVNLQAVYSAIKQSNEYAKMYWSILMQPLDLRQLSHKALNELQTTYHKGLREMMPQAIDMLKS